MKKWTYPVETYSPTQVQEYCVQDKEWQRFRLSMKGKPTEEKLDMLNLYLAERVTCSKMFLQERHRIQIDNYINALLRGGQLKHSEGGIVVQR